MGQKVISFLGDAECKYCRIPLIFKEKNEITIPLDLNGNILHDEECDDYYSYLQCEQCGRTFDFVQVPTGYKISTLLEQKLDIFKMLEKLEKNPNKSPFVKGD